MSWELASLAILGLTLLAGLAWYERSRPPSQLVALVAALAALAVAGRVALSPVPNVVPTTDITILAGYALGGPPGFAVGALSGLISNFWLGQGPWTPWQMAGWGLCGVLGAALAAATGRRLGRIGLAAVCGAAGLAFGALMDFSLMASYGGEQSLDRFMALSARGLPFNIAHAAGNVALALAAGPAISRMLVRYRERFQFAWAEPGARPPRPRGRGALAGLGCLLALTPALVPLLKGPPASGAGGGPGAAVAWLRAAQNPDGGYGPSPSDESDPAMTGWAALAIEAAGINPLDFGSPNPVSYLRGTVSEIRTTGDIERTILVLSGAGLDPRDFAGTDLVERLRRRRGGDGSLAGQVNLTAFSIMALEAAGSPGGNGHSAAWLARARNRGGGWGLARGAGSEADSTGAAMQGLVAAGHGGARAGVRYLRSAQARNGGFRLYGGPVNSQSTAWAVQGLVAAGAEPGTIRTHGRSPLDYLAGAQAADGHYRYSSSSDQTPVWVTAQALTAVERQAYPIAEVPRAEGGGSGGGGAAEASAADGKAKKGAGPGAGRSNRTAKPDTGSEDEPDPGATPYAPVASGSPGDESHSSLPWVAMGVALMGAAVWVGWLLYRRRLP